jgi:hypothetical protein
VEPTGPLARPAVALRMETAARLTTSILPSAASDSWATTRCRPALASRYVWLSDDGPAITRSTVEPVARPHISGTRSLPVLLVGRKQHVETGVRHRNRIHTYMEA